MQAAQCDLRMNWPDLTLPPINLWSLPHALSNSHSLRFTHSSHVTAGSGCSLPKSSNQETIRRSEWIPAWQKGLHR